MISDDDDDSFISNTDSEGGCRDTDADDGSEGAIPNEGAQGPNFASMVKVIVGLYAGVTLLIG